jgi:molecular chaperone DnaK
LSKEEVEKMRESAKANEAADKTAREKIDKLNHADSLIFQTEKQLKEFGDKISGTNKEAINGALSALKYAHEHQDIAGIDRSMADLNTAWNAASEEMYKTTDNTSAAGAEAGGQPAGGDGDATDVQFEEVN